jgi:hypothetical protein
LLGAALSFCRVSDELQKELGGVRRTAVRNSCADTQPNAIDVDPFLSADSSFAQDGHHRAPVRKPRLKQIQANKSRE